LTSTPNVAFAIYYDADNDGYHDLYDGRFPTAAAAWTQLMSGSRDDRHPSSAADSRR
jgi:hypothetical protein